MLPRGLELPEAGEAAAGQRWQAYVEEHLADYDDERDRPDLDTTSRMSRHLKWGEIHPRTMLADLQGRTGKGAVAYRRELAFREFYADVLFQRPDSAREYLRPEFATMPYDEPGDQLDAWREGRTGFPIVDAGMRQLRADRLDAQPRADDRRDASWSRTCTSSGSTAHATSCAASSTATSRPTSTAGSGSRAAGTDAAPYFRVFNPTTQGAKFDPDGTYVRRWVPELADVPAKHVHEPSALPDGLPDGYPEPIVDHKAERVEALERYERIRA